METNFGLRELPRDDRDLVMGEVFRLPRPEELPDNFMVGEPFKIKDQGNSDYCTAFAATSASELQEGVELSPEWHFAASKAISGDIDAWGQNLRDAVKVLTKYGSILQSEAPYRLGDPNIRDLFMWDSSLEDSAKVHKKQSYFRADKGSNSVFDNIRATIYGRKTAVITGSLWYSNWLSSIKGLITKSESPLMGHAYTILGWKTLVEGAKPKKFLVVQNSYGGSVGDKGLFYISEDVVNNEFTYGAFGIEDLPPDVAKRIQEGDYYYDDLIFTRIWIAIKNWFKSWF